MQSASWYLKRLSLMSPSEMIWRLAHAASARAAVMSGHGDVPSRKAAVTLGLPEWLAPSGTNSKSYTAAADRVLAGEAELFGTWMKVGEGATDWNRDPTSGTQAPLTHGKLLDYRDSRLVGSARAIWEVNRHFQLVTLAQAWALTKDERYRAAGIALLSSWITACPYPLGVNWASALEHGIRLINWYAAARLFALTKSEVEAIPGWVDSIYRHCDFIWKNQSRFSSANNHLIGEMVGLFIAATAWPYWQKSDWWRSRAKQILEREAVLQVHADGFGREQSIGYQMFVLQFLIVAGLVGESNNDPFSAAFWQIVQRMLTVLDSVQDSSGHLPDFGDSDEGVVLLLSPNAREQRLEDLLILYRQFSGAKPRGSERPSAVDWLTSGFPRPINWPAEGVQRRTAFSDGGYYVLGDKFGTAEEVIAVFDAAPLGFLSIAAHGHADCLSFTLSVGGNQLLVDPGTYCYHDNPRWRDYFRSTAAHNTIRIDGLDQSEMAGPFMWLRRAEPTLLRSELGAHESRVKASHDGYTRLPDPVTHERELHFSADAACLEVFDALQSKGEHMAEQFWHFAETCVVQRAAGNTVRVAFPAAVVEFEFDPAGQMDVINGRESPISGWISRRFGERSPTTTIIIKRPFTGSTSMTTRIRWAVTSADQSHAGSATPATRV